MATTVDNSFAQFLTNTVRLDPERTKIAKSSMKWLIEEIIKFPADGKFPTLHPDVYIEYGSFSRKTKTRPLDDVDLMIILHAQGATYNEYSNPTIVFNAANATHFSNLYFDSDNSINSIKVINKFKDYLAGIPQYRKADIKRNQEAVTLELQSYEWVFDIVPCFITNPEPDGRTYYLIPDGKGNWKKTDPRIDKNRVVSINAKHSISILDIIRSIKYWNVRPTMPTMKSYMLENMTLNYYEAATTTTNYIDLELRDLFLYIANNIHSPINDPKKIQGDLNTLSWDERVKIHNRATVDRNKAIEARTFEQNGQTKEAITKWREIFGSEFPDHNA